MTEPGDFDRAARLRVLEPLEREDLTGSSFVDIELVSGLPERWDVWIYRGFAPPYGIMPAGRILIGPPTDPLGALLYSKEHGRFRITHVWVDKPERGKGIGRLLIALYQRWLPLPPRGTDEGRSRRVLYAVGPFSAGGRALMLATGVKILPK